ncbi:MAG: hypothetical protein OHK0037_06080 [Elainellaceae cyanobacterium]
MNLDMQSTGQWQRLLLSFGVLLSAIVVGAQAAAAEDIAKSSDIRAIAT